jgi:CheY-like chemotaxis protein
VLVTRILVVEDNDLNRDVLSRRLVRQGFEVLAAANGQDGMSLARGERPDLVLLDLGMPDVDGWECARQLKQAHVTASIPIIALTAHAMLGDRERALAAGCDDFDTKPIDFAALLKRIDRLLQATVATEQP